MARKKAATKSDFIGKLEAQILEMLANEDLEPAARIQLINAGTRLATARHKISGDDDEGSFFSD